MLSSDGEVPLVLEQGHSFEVRFLGPRVHPSSPEALHDDHALDQLPIHVSDVRAEARESIAISRRQE